MNQTKLLSSNPDRLDLLMESEQFSEVLSPVVQPQAINDEEQIDHLLIQIGCHSNRPVSLHKLHTLMSSFLLQAAPRQQSTTKRRADGYRLAT